MKKLVTTIIKIIIFFVGWAVFVSILPIPETTNPAIWRLWAEVIPLLIIIMFNLIFWLIEKRVFSLQLFTDPVRSSLTGIITGFIWLGIVAGILAFSGAMRIDGCSAVPLIGVWLLSAFLNTIMQELLVRGYLYQMIKHRYNLVAATIVSTLLFTFLHGGAFEAGLIPVLNVFTMSLLMTVVLEFTRSLIAPIMMHFLWNGIGAIVLGGVSLAEDYPHIFNTLFQGNEFLSGGVYKMEGSIIVLVVNILFIFGFYYAHRKRIPN